MIQIVVDRFMNVKEPTKRKDLVTQFRSPRAVDRLISLGILKALDNHGHLAPSPLGVESSGDSDSVARGEVVFGSCSAGSTENQTVPLRSEFFRYFPLCAFQPGQHEFGLRKP